jgi:hypothetical protein
MEIYSYNAAQVRDPASRLSRGDRYAVGQVINLLPVGRGDCVVTLPKRFLNNPPEPFVAMTKHR